MKTITILIEPDGKVKSEGSGFKGKECEKAMAWIDDALGKPTIVRKKPEYFQQVQAKQKVG